MQVGPEIPGAALIPVSGLQSLHISVCLKKGRPSYPFPPSPHVCSIPQAPSLISVENTTRNNVKSCLTLRLCHGGMLCTSDAMGGRLCTHAYLNPASVAAASLLGYSLCINQAGHATICIWSPYEATKLISPPPLIGYICPCSDVLDLFSRQCQ